MADKQLRESWNKMKQRCLNTNSPDYFRYGNRGIGISKEWLSFQNFKKDMSESHFQGATLERFDNNGNYCKENCKWATRKEQANNTRNIERALKYTYDGLTLTVRQWSERLGIKRTTLDMRLRHYRWPVEQALEGGVLHR